MPFWVGGYFGWSHLGENWRTLKGTNWNILELSDGTQNHLLKKFQQYTFPPIKEITTVYLHDQSPPKRMINLRQLEEFCGIILGGMIGFRWGPFRSKIG